MANQSFGFDLAAASLLADSAERVGALEVFATKLEGALLDACRIYRRRQSLLSRRTRVEAIAVDLGESLFLLYLKGNNLVAGRTDRVHDMRKRTRAAQPARVAGGARIRVAPPRRLRSRGSGSD